MTTKPMPYTYVIKAVLLWAPILLLPFTVLLVETMLRLDVFYRDYRTTVLVNQIQSLQQDLKDLRAQEANLEAMRRLEAMAMELGLVAPAHDQIVLVEVPRESTPIPQPITFARLDALSQSIRTSDRAKGGDPP